MCRESREDKECLLTKSRKDKKDRKRIVVAATGASGLPILKMCLQIIREDSDYESILILSDSAKITLQQETKDTVEEIEALATLPNREGMLSMLLSVLQAPVRNVAYAVKAVAEKEEDAA